jgi:hypothetical protein
MGAPKKNCWVAPDGYRPAMAYVLLAHATSMSSAHDNAGGVGGDGSGDDGGGAAPLPPAGPAPPAERSPSRPRSSHGGGPSSLDAQHHAAMEHVRAAHAGLPLFPKAGEFLAALAPGRCAAIAGVLRAVLAAVGWMALPRLLHFGCTASFLAGH